MKRSGQVGVSIAMCCMLPACVGFNARLSSLDDRPLSVGLEQREGGYETRCVVRERVVGDAVVLRTRDAKADVLLARSTGETRRLYFGHWTRLIDLDADELASLVEVLDRARQGQVQNRIPALEPESPPPLLPAHASPEHRSLTTMTVTGSRVRRMDDRKEAEQLLARLRAGELPDRAWRTEGGFVVAFRSDELTLLPGDGAVYATAYFPDPADLIGRRFPERPEPLDCSSR